MDRAVRTIVSLLERHGYSESSRFAVRLAIEEALSNAFKHGHKSLPPSTPVRFAFAADARELRLTIEDRGPGFNPASVPDPTLDENLEMPSGRGLMLIRAYMTTVEFNAPGNRLTLVYRKPPGKS
jgi:serine/threonine-protein kinase RsbW